MSLWARKPLHAFTDDAAAVGDTISLRPALSATSLTLIGIGSMIGAGIFVLTGTAAANYAGPALSLSFVIAGIGCLCAALCYAELAAMIPVAGSSYSYAYATFGEFIAWIVGWNVVLEYLINASTIAVGWSAYFTSWLAGHGVHLPAAFANAPFATDGMHLQLTGAVLNLPAVLVTLALTAVLVVGIRESARLNNIVVYIKVAVVLAVIVFGAFYVQPANWHPYIPENTTGKFGQFGLTGVLQAAAIIFFAYIGFETISTTAQEAHNPQRDVPRSLMLSLGICTILYIAMATVLTGMVSYTQLNVANPVSVAIDAAGDGLRWLKEFILIGAVIGLASAILAGLLAQTRIFYSMGRDGLIPPLFARLHPRFRTPHHGTIIVGAVAALVAGLFPIDLLGELVSIGTLTAFAIVCGGVLALRRTAPTLARPFRVPCSPFVPIAGVVSCLALMFALPDATWIRLVVWLAIGVAIYGLYSRRHSKLRHALIPESAS
jgi:APA family basic amino acid/polyamine antiporter